MKKKSFLLVGLALCAMSANAQQFKEGYINWGANLSEKFHETLWNWNLGDQVTEDDNFFISRVKPKAYFRNAKTQVNPALDETNDKKLINWIPVNDPLMNALPDGKFDSEVFPMWNYVTHYGNWTAPFVRMPGNFADVAHKNGCAVSVVAGIPYGGLDSKGWGNTLAQLTSIGASKMADFLAYYGVDGLGYNSEFSGGGNVVGQIRTFHEELVKIMKTQKGNFLFENMWYDGTNDTGGIQFDNGLQGHNDDTFGDSNHVRTSLFFNYNWNSDYLMSESVKNAQKMGRNPLDLYCGINMQGGEPRYDSWPFLENHNLSIGLWGAHSKNMFWESRNEKGAKPEVQQRTYLQRVERYYTSGSRNPLNNKKVTSSMSYSADNFDFFGMSHFMSARSTLKWDLSNEPFISYFNLGNGKFFNWKGERTSNSSWYNVGVQDYLPTWRFWLTKSFMGRTVSDLVENGLDAEFVWDDAWMGGSLLRVFGTSKEEFLHLFKTEFGLKAGDVITVRYKLMGGEADVNLALSVLGAENTRVKEDQLKVMEVGSAKRGQWTEKKFVVRGSLMALNNKDLAMVALHFKNAKNLNLYLGEFSIVRGNETSTKPATPKITKTQVLASNHHGVDGKIIFNMPNNKPKTEVCYNLDVKTSLFKLYAQQEGKEPILMTTTTSWAGMYYAVPVDYTVSAPKIRFGVSAVSLDFSTESDIAWGKYQSTGTYKIDDDVKLSKSTIKPNESFAAFYVDDKHEVAKWEILDGSGKVIKSEESALGIEVAEGLSSVGNYSLRVTGKVASENGRVDKVRTFGNFIQISGTEVGALPEILTLTANEKESDVEVEISNPVANLAYTGRVANGQGSRGLNLNEQAFGFKASDFNMQPEQSFSIAFWLKLNSLADMENQMLNIRDKSEGWPKTDWGWIWTNVNSDGSFGSHTFRGTDASNNNELRYRFEKSKLEVGPWTHIAYVFDYKGSSLKFTLYVNGVKQEVTSWNRSTDGDVYTSGEPSYQSQIYSMRGANMVAIGGSAAFRAGLDGTLDNFQYYDKALTAEEVKTSMGNISTDKLPANLQGFWSFEQDPEGSGFVNEGLYAPNGVRPKAGVHGYIAGAGEGMGSVVWIAPTFTPGCPFVKGSAYKVVTTPSWSARMADVTEVQGNDETGSAKVTFLEEGTYGVTLTLENGWGSDSKTFQYITVKGTETGINGVDAEVVTYENPFVDEVVVRFAEEGEYTVRVFSLNGALVAERTQPVAEGEFVRLAVNGEQGHYVAQILKDGKLLNVLKLIKK